MVSVFKLVYTYVQIQKIQEADVLEESHVAGCIFSSSWEPSAVDCPLGVFLKGNLSCLLLLKWNNAKQVLWLLGHVGLATWDLCAVTHGPALQGPAAPDKVSMQTLLYKARVKEPRHWQHSPCDTIFIISIHEVKWCEGGVGELGKIYNRYNSRIIDSIFFYLRLTFDIFFFGIEGTFLVLEYWYLRWLTQF